MLVARPQRIGFRLSPPHVFFKTRQSSTANRSRLFCHHFFLRSPLFSPSFLPLLEEDVINDVPLEFFSRKGYKSRWEWHSHAAPFLKEKGSSSESWPGQSGRKNTLKLCALLTNAAQTASILGRSPSASRKAKHLFCTTPTQKLSTEGRRRLGPHILRCFQSGIRQYEAMLVQ